MALHQVSTDHKRGTVRYLHTCFPLPCSDSLFSILLSLCFCHKCSERIHCSGVENLLKKILEYWSTIGYLNLFLAGLANHSLHVSCETWKIVFIDYNTDFHTIYGSVKNEFRWPWLEEKDSNGDFSSDKI